MNDKITPIIDQATRNLRVKQLYDQAGMTWDMQWAKLAEKAEGKGISIVPYIVTGSGQYLMPEFNKAEFARLIIQKCVQLAVNEEERFYNMDQDELALAMENFQALLKQHFGVQE